MQPPNLQTMNPQTSAGVKRPRAEESTEDEGRSDCGSNRTINNDFRGPAPFTTPTADKTSGVNMYTPISKLNMES
ncbi:hypothetical protein LINPERHAP1_LOCUS15508, partial [Linum perenne]